MPVVSATYNFLAAPLHGDSPLTVAFTDLSTGFNSSWAWNFGDGSTSTDRNPTHVYTTPGLYTVTLLVNGSITVSKDAYINVTGTVINKLTLPPDQLGYGVSAGNDFFRAVNDGAAGKYQRNLFNNSNLISCTWICTEAEYNYLALFFKNNKQKKFKIDLLFDDIAQLVEYFAQFVPGSFKLSSVAGLTFTVTANLEVRAHKFKGPITFDAGLTNLKFNIPTLYISIDGQDSNRDTSYHPAISSTGSFTFVGFDLDEPLIGYFISANTSSFNIVGGNSTYHLDDAPLVGPLDNYQDGIWGAWSDKLLISTWLDNAVWRVSRSSDNAQSDFLASNIDDIASFCGSGEGYLVTEYDQTGNNNHKTSSNPSDWPLVCSGGVYLGYENYTTNRLLTPNSSGANTAQTLIINGNLRNTSGLQIFAEHNEGVTGENPVFYLNGTTLTLNVNRNGAAIVYASSNQWQTKQVLAFVMNTLGASLADKVKLYADGIQQTLSLLTSSGTFAGNWHAGPWSFGGRSSGNHAAFNGYSSVIYENEVSAGDLSLISAALAAPPVTFGKFRERESGGRRLREGGNFRKLES